MEAAAKKHLAFRVVSSPRRPGRHSPWRRSKRNVGRAHSPARRCAAARRLVRRAERVATTTRSTTRRA